MRFAIAGAGAIGGYLGAVMARAGLEVALIARGPHLGAIESRGVRIREGGSEWLARPFATDDPAAIGPVDVVFLTAKAHSLPELAPRLAPLLGPPTAVVTLQNGIPWWFLPEPLERLDPGGAISAAIERRRVVAGVIYCSAEVEEPGVIRHIAGGRISVGEPDGCPTARCYAISQALVAAGIEASATADIRAELWTKLLGNVSFNPISALTGADMTAILEDPATRRLLYDVMCETEAVGHALGITLPISVEQRIAISEQMGAHKTSMLQDLEAGRPLELEALVGAVIELAARHGVPVPHTETLYACARLLAPR